MGLYEILYLLEKQISKTHTYMRREEEIEEALDTLKNVIFDIEENEKDYIEEDNYWNKGDINETC